MDFLKCAGIINDEYYYADGNGFVFPNRTNSDIKNISTDPSTNFVFDRGCVYDGYNYTYLLGTSNNDPNVITSYRVSTLENQNTTISVDKNDQLSFTYVPDLSQPVIFITVNDYPNWCALYNSNDSGAVNTVWEECSQSNGPENITTSLNITSLSNWVAGANSGIIYHLTDKELLLYNASTTNITYSKTYPLNNDILLTQSQSWSFVVAGYSNFFEFAVTDGTKVQTVAVPHGAQNGTSATVNLIDNTGIQQNSSYVFSNDQNSTLQSINGNGIKQLAALSQNSATQIHSTSSADPTVSSDKSNQINSDQNPTLSTGQIVGIAVGSGIAFIMIVVIAVLLLCILPRRRKKRGLSIATTSTSPIIYSDNSTYGYGTSTIGLDKLNNPQEGDPDFTEYSSIFNKSCDIQTNVKGEKLSEGPFLRKCEYTIKKRRPAMIHYFTSEQKEHFDKSLMVLKSLNDQSGRIIQLYKAFELESPSPKYQIEYILITSSYEPKNNLRTLYAREGNLHNYISLSDDVFKVWVIYSILTALQTLHQKNFAHNRLSLEAFYAETNAPSMDWTLGDFYYAQVNNPEAKVNDILKVGHIIYDIVFEKAPLTQQSDYSNIILDTNQIKGAYKEHFSYLLDRTFYPNNSKQTNAKELLEYWEKHFRF